MDAGDVLVSVPFTRGTPPWHAQVQRERAAAFVEREKQTLSRWTELFPNYAWTDSATAIDLMAAEIKCLRSELLDACRFATSLRGFARPIMVRATTKPASWTEWTKTCARLTALLIEIRARWYGGTFSATDPACSGVEAESVAMASIRANDSTDELGVGDDRAEIIYKDGTDPS